jgi:hypothetical protein
MIDRQGQALRNERGKLGYVSVLEFTERATRDAFSERVIEALLASFPHAFDKRESAP